MLFSSPIFLFAFLPAVLLAYFLVPFRVKNLILLIFSLLFYAWGESAYVVVMIFSIAMNYVAGLSIEKAQNLRARKLMLGFAVAINLAILGGFKYLAFLAESLNTLIIPVLDTELPEVRLHLPIGISFFTFQAISYIVDVYRRKVEVQRNPVKLGLYISLFPQLIAGPIVRYDHIRQQLSERTHTAEKFYYGIQRFSIGLGKKLLIANNMAYIADEIFSFAPSELSFLPAWLGVIAYALQIYFDFAGYSDMAIGLASMFGFRIPENFNFPYIARSIREFWRRWHISLSTWFRDYLYIPLGGNRGAKSRTALNLLIVFFLTGLWHGADFTFIIWGLFHGFFMILERGKFGSFLQRHSFISHAYTLFVVLFAWVFFRANDLDYALGYIGQMLVPDFHQTGKVLSLFLLDAEKWLFLILGILFSTKLLENVIKKLRKLTSPPLFTALKSFAILALLFVSVLYLTSDTYNPFIYFRF